jgi:hypothetical protein
MANTAAFPLNHATFDALTVALGAAMGIPSWEDVKRIHRPYLCFKTAEQIRSKSDYAVPMGHAVLTKAGDLYDYCAKKTYRSVEEWYADRGPELLQQAAAHLLPPLQSELLFGRDGNFLGFEQIRAAAAAAGSLFDESVEGILGDMSSMSLSARVPSGWREFVLKGFQAEQTFREVM